MPFVGSADTLTLTIDQAGPDTDATVQILADGGVTLAPDSGPSTADPDRRLWAAGVTWPTPGLWVAVWTVTGTGAGLTTDTVFVEPIPSPAGPLWRPSRTEVARWVPGRTLVLNRATGANPPEYTFDDTTQPTGAVVDGLATDAVSWVLTRCGPIAASPISLVGMATACAAVFVAAAVERGYPDRNPDVTTAADLLKLAIQMREDLRVANEAAAGVDPTNPASLLVPLYQFPPPPRWADRDFT